jgi:hypothetical protein
MNADLGWYCRRLRQMSPAEVGWRIGDRLRQEVWSRRDSSSLADHSRRSRSVSEVGSAVTGSAIPRVVPVLPPDVDLSRMGEENERALLCAADRLLGGRAEVLGTIRTDLRDPTWELDPISGCAYPVGQDAFRIDYRNAGDHRNVKQVWELSRLHHVTLLACAWQLTGDDRYAAMAAGHLRSWWAKNPVLRGVNWSSGIELGIRLISWVWARRLLTGWHGAPSLFEENDAFANQLYWHQRTLAAFPSRGSSRNNHVIAEAAGQLAACCAFPWFVESRHWRRESAALFSRELERNTFTDGLNREQAFDYHGLVAELGLVAGAEAEAAGSPLDEQTWARLCQMVDVVAAVLDRSGGAPRYGDGDDGRALVVADPGANRWRSLLSLGAAVFGPQPWWPATFDDAQSLLVGSLVRRVVGDTTRPAVRPSHFPEAGLTVLRSPADDPEELWCRCDGGPHGFLSIAAHGHADALSIELRHNGTEVLCDPGTYCYHTDPLWRAYFRSTLGHNTVELDGEDQSVAGGPFLWTRHAQGRTLEVSTTGAIQSWSAEHDGYRRLASPARHRRSVTLDVAARSLVVIDRLQSNGAHRVRAAFHLGPEVEGRLDGHHAALLWRSPEGRQQRASMVLPGELTWSAHRGGDDPILGWYSPRFGTKVPSTTLVGEGMIATAALRTEVRLASDG